MPDCWEGGWAGGGWVGYPLLWPPDDPDFVSAIALDPEDCAVFVIPQEAFQ